MKMLLLRFFFFYLIFLHCKLYYQHNKEWFQSWIENRSEYIWIALIREHRAATLKCWVKKWWLQLSPQCVTDNFALDCHYYRVFIMHLRVKMSFEILIWSNFHNSLLLMCVFFRLRPLHRPLVRLLALHTSSFCTLTELKLVIWGQASTAITSALRNFITETWFTFLALKTSGRWGCLALSMWICAESCCFEHFFFTLIWQDI